MAYPAEISTRDITGTFVNIVYDKVAQTYGTEPKEGFVHVSPSVKTIRSLTTDIVYDLSDLVNTYYKLDETGSFTATVMVPTDPDIEPNNWHYTVTFGWSRTPVVIPDYLLATGSGEINISSLYVPSG
jgi:hypothetical protein